MCLALPMKIVKIDGPKATGEAGGLTREIRLDFMPQVTLGDYVMVHAGFAIQRMSEEEALENVRLLEEIRDAL